MKEINGAKDLKNKTIILVEYEKVYPPEYFKPHRGRRSSITSYSLNKEKVVGITKVTVDTATTGRAFEDMDQKKMATRLYYHDENGNTGTLRLEANPIFLELTDSTYIHKDLESVADQIKELLNG